MNTHELRRRMHILDEFGLWGTTAAYDGAGGHVTGPKHRAGDSVRSRLADSVWARSMFLPPWRDRLADGRLGPEYGPVAPTPWHQSWMTWRESRAGGGLWDAETEWRCRPRPQPQPAERAFLEVEVFLVRYGHTLTARELEVASLYWRDKLRPSAIARRIGLKSSDVNGLMRGVIQKWSEASARRGAA